MLDLREEASSSRWQLEVGGALHGLSDASVMPLVPGPCPRFLYERHCEEARWTRGGTAARDPELSTRRARHLVTSIRFSFDSFARRKLASQQRRPRSPKAKKPQGRLRATETRDVS